MNRRRLFLLIASLYCASIVCFLLLILTTHIHNFPPDAFYYSAQLPIFYWLGLLCLFVIIYLKYRYYASIPLNSPVDLPVILGLVFYLYGTPCFIYDNIRFTDAYFVARDVSCLIGAHHTTIGTGFGYLHEFPGFHILVSQICIVINVNPMIFGKYYPILLLSFMSVFVYVISSKFSDKYSIIPPLVLLGLCWTQEYHLAPQSFGLLIYILLWVLLLDSFIPDKFNSPKLYLSLIVIVTIVVCHPASPMFFILNGFVILFAIILFKKLGVKSANNFSNCSHLIFLYLLFAVVWIVWLYYIATQINYIFSDIITKIIDNLGSDRSVSVSATIPGNPNFSYSVVNVIRLFITYFEVILPFASIVVIYTWGCRERYREYILLLALWFVSCFIYAALSIFNHGIHMGRAFIFAVFPISIILMLTYEVNYCETNRFVKRCIKGLKIIITLYVVISIIFIPFTRYGGDSSEYISQSYVSANVFFADYQDEFSKYLRYSTITFNQYELKLQRGADYLESFNNPANHRIYSSKGENIVIVE